MKNILKGIVIIAGLSVAIAAEAAQTPYPTLILRTAPGVPLPAGLTMNIQVSQDSYFTLTPVCNVFSTTSVATMRPTQVEKCAQTFPTPNTFYFVAYIINANGNVGGGVGCAAGPIKIPVSYSKSIITINKFRSEPEGVFPASCTASTN
ncbi:MAG TPA: hypothetical protein VJK30_00885 [Coxiellaceae bacterium]|nr:MAG: hypothetical protein A3E81_05055 [Gammaproteobacteria bacterium RIFCSPHIGHO2_12_FULL_36_30]HLB55873.1 hypothetical protein [Coxiellaceae bacterium]